MRGRPKIVIVQACAGGKLQAIELSPPQSFVDNPLLATVMLMYI